MDSDSESALDSFELVLDSFELALDSAAEQVAPDSFELTLDSFELVQNGAPAARARKKKSANMQNASANRQNSARGPAPTCK
jgi:hypothetical protein